MRMLQSRRKGYDAYRNKHHHREQMYMSARRRHATCILSDQMLEARSFFAAIEDRDRGFNLDHLRDDDSYLTLAVYLVLMR